MTQEEIIKMAIDAIGGDMNGQDVQHLAWRLANFKDDVYQFGPDALLKFVAMIEAAEREKCAKLVETLTCMGNAKECFEVAATYIRARGQE